jgi:hypothetical protein
LAEVFAERATALDLTIPQAMNRSRPIGRTTIRCRPFVRLTSFSGEGRVLDGRCDHVAGHTRSQLRPEGVGRTLSLPGQIAKVSAIADALPKEFQKAFAP